VSILSEFLYFGTGRTMIEEVKLGTGLAVIRYKSIGKKGNAVITADIPPSSRDSLTLLTDPTAPDDALAAPGDCWVVQCRRPSVLSLNIESAQPGAAARGSVVVEYISDQSGQDRSASGEQVRPTNERQPTNRQRAFSAHEVPKVMAHVANLGDIFAEAGDWLRGDGRNDSIEGLCMPTSGFAQIMMRDVNSGQTAEPGIYLGSRGQFRSLGAVEMWLEAPARSEELRVEALFKEAGFREASGTSFTLAGIDNRDLLMGIKIWFQVKQDSPRIDSRGSRNVTSGTERMKIFRK
jgi:hypothetical protein